jgi:hypothetical protein
MHKELSKSLFEKHSLFCSNERLLILRSWKIILQEYPILMVEFSQSNKRSIRVRMNCTDWDELPPSIEILDVESVLLDANRFPRGNNVFNQSLHPITNKPFICSPGSLEYHQHTSHITDLWENYKSKSEYDLGGILTQIWNAWRVTT